MASLTNAQRRTIKKLKKQRDLALGELDPLKQLQAQHDADMLQVEAKYDKQILAHTEAAIKLLNRAKTAEEALEQTHSRLKATVIQNDRLRGAVDELEKKLEDSDIKSYQKRIRAKTEALEQEQALYAELERGMAKVKRESHQNEERVMHLTLQLARAEKALGEAIEEIKSRQEKQQFVTPASSGYTPTDEGVEETTRGLPPIDESTAVNEASHG